MERFRTIRDMIAYRAEKAPSNDALEYEQDGIVRYVSYSELLYLVDRRAEKLKNSEGSTIGILSDGSYACVLEILSALTAGKRIVMLDENLDDDNLKALISYTDCDSLWSSDEELIEDLRDSLVTSIYGNGGDILFFTSGTTERSKAVVLTEESLLSSAYNGSYILPLTPDDVLLCMLPLGHVFGFVCGLLWGLSCGAAVALGRGPRYYAADCSFFKPTAVSLVPMLLGFLLKSGAFNPELRIILIGAGDCSDELINAAKTLGKQVCFGYGLTETSSGVALSVSEDPRAMAVCPDFRIMIASDGEILIEGAPCMMKGYYKMPEATNAVLKDGVLTSGDLGYMDEDGKLHITGRKKEMLVLSDGTKIFLPEYEKECRTALGEDDLCIFKKDEDICIAVCPNVEVSEKDVLEKLRDVIFRRPRGQQIRKVIIRNTPLPRTVSGKIKRWELEKEL
ncbi:MAG: acyl--CoA ligase [Oscillospiraceae bacterium]|nr:acyl--CoA ligase [Oscillospiraceae bacterium]